MAREIFRVDSVFRAILDLRSNGRMGKNYALAQRAGTAQDNALGMNALRFSSLKDCNCQIFFIRRPCQRGVYLFVIDFYLAFI
jgi:hypothetical protein